MNFWHLIHYCVPFNELKIDFGIFWKFSSLFLILRFRPEQSLVINIYWNILYIIYTLSFKSYNRRFSSLYSNPWEKNLKIFNIFLKIFSQGLEYKGDQWPTPSYNSAPAVPWAWEWAASWCSSWCCQSPACSTPSLGARDPGLGCGHQLCWQMSGLKQRKIKKMFLPNKSLLLIREAFI